MKRLGLYGCGHLNKIVVDCYKKGLLEGYEIVGCYSRTLESRTEMANDLGVEVCNSYDELLDRNVDYIVEATNPAATKAILAETLNRGVSIVLLFIGALADEEYYEEMKKLCVKNNVRIHLASGAICGFEVLRTARIMGLTKSGLTNTKGPRALSKSKLFKPEMVYEDTVAFSGSAYDAIQNLPTGINVGVATALATMGVHDTSILIQSKPGFIGDSQCINIECGDEIKAHLDVYSRTSDIAGYSVVALLQNLESPIVF
jgi:aspartate dehydrogenase